MQVGDASVQMHASDLLQQLDVLERGGENGGYSRESASGVAVETGVTNSLANHQHTSAATQDAAVASTLAAAAIDAPALSSA